MKMIDATEIKVISDNHASSSFHGDAQGKIIIVDGEDSGGSHPTVMVFAGQWANCSGQNFTTVITEIRLITMSAKYGIEFGVRDEEGWDGIGEIEWSENFETKVLNVAYPGYEEVTEADDGDDFYPATG